MVRYFISDLHINNSGILSELFIDLLTRIKDADELYILGDLFEVWFGDDIELLQYAQVINALQNTAKTVKIYFISGNRDFLVGTDFFKKTGIIQLPDPYLFKINNTNICLTHGDIFCTLDRKYQFFRKIVRNKLIRTLFLSLPKFFRTKIGRFIRNKSQFAKREYRDLTKFDINPQAIKPFIKNNKVNLIIHGHTHTPLVEHYDELNCNRYVLAEWKAGSALILKLDDNNKIAHLEQATAN